MLERLPIIGRWLAPDPALVERLRAVIASRRARSITDAASYDAWVRDAAHQLGIAPDEVELLASAIHSYELRKTVMRGAHMSYDDAHRKIFHALDRMAQDGDGV
jgi:hypothetical protein